MRLYGPRIRINYCSPGNIGNWSLQHSPQSWKYWKTDVLIQSYPGNIGNWMFPISPYPGNIGNMIFLSFWFLYKKTRAEISRRMHRSMGRDLSYETNSSLKTKNVSDPNFQVTPTRTATATARRQLSHLARPLDHHAQGPNIPFGVNPSLRSWRFASLTE